MTSARNNSPDRSRWLVLVACSIAMLAIANLQYAWTLFTTDLTKSLHARLDAVQWTLTFFIIAQTALFPLNAYLTDRIGPRLVVGVASVLVAIGWIGAGLAGSLPALYASYAIGGVGAGAVYGACVGVAIKWFPNHRGLCVGIVAGSYGFGTALTVLPIDYLIKSSGYRSAFIIFGALQGIVGMTAAPLIRMPPEGWLAEGWEAIKAKVQRKVVQSLYDYSPRQMLKSGSFYLLYLM